MSEFSKNNFSVVTCTYNPDPDKIKRVLSAVKKINNKVSFDHILVDNNSEPPLSSIINELPDNCRVVVEKQQGLAYARLKGVQEAKGNWIVFIDDDNLPHEDYLIELEKIINEYPNVGVWGPGKITIEFEIQPPKWISNYFLTAYQQKDLQNTYSGISENWPEYFPAGSGMCIRKDLFNDYAKKLESGLYSVTGRKGNTLSSGEDAQIVWNCTHQGIPVGSSTSLKLIHIIPETRINLKYLRKLYFHLSIGYYYAKSEIFGVESILREEPRFISYIKKGLLALQKAKFNPATALKIYIIEKAWLDGYLKFFKTNQIGKNTGVKK
ncbi:MAG: glycosyltransferase [Bacteroidota bacterium]|jgi:glycosyltransferase involved in cell wall biosynthesis